MLSSYYSFVVLCGILCADVPPRIDSITRSVSQSLSRVTSHVHCCCCRSGGRWSEGQEGQGRSGTSYQDYCYEQAVWAWGLSRRLSRRCMQLVLHYCWYSLNSDLYLLFYYVEQQLYARTSCQYYVQISCNWVYSSFIGRRILIIILVHFVVGIWICWIVYDKLA